MKPSIGRIVHVYRGTSHLPTAAIITYVHSDTLLNLTTFPDRDELGVLTSVTLYPGEAEARDALDVGLSSIAAFWPPRT